MRGSQLVGCVCGKWVGYVWLIGKLRVWSVCRLRVLSVGRLRVWSVGWLRVWPVGRLCGVVSLWAVCVG